MNDEIEVFGRHVPICDVIALLVLLAARKREAQPCGVGNGTRCRACTADGAHRLAGAKAIPVGASRLEALNIDMHRMPPLRRSARLAAPGDLAERLVGGDFPRHLDRCTGECRRIGRRESRPQGHAFRVREAGCDAEREWRGSKSWLREQSRPRRDERGRECPRLLQEDAAIGQHSGLIPQTHYNAGMYRFADVTGASGIMKNR